MPRTAQGPLGQGGVHRTSGMVNMDLGRSIVTMTSAHGIRLALEPATDPGNQSQSGGVRRTVETSMNKYCMRLWALLAASPSDTRGRQVPKTVMGVPRQGQRLKKSARQGPLLRG